MIETGNVTKGPDLSKSTKSLLDFHRLAVGGSGLHSGQRRFSSLLYLFGGRLSRYGIVTSNATATTELPPHLAPVNSENRLC
jgi:hypothetical protein